MVKGQYTISLIFFKYFFKRRKSSIEYHHFLKKLYVLLAPTYRMESKACIVLTTSISTGKIAITDNCFLLSPSRTFLYLFNLST